MTTRADPVNLPHQPEVLFDALFMALPGTQLQVTWADRQLGAIATVSRALGRQAYYCTIYVRAWDAGGSVVLIQATINERIVGDAEDTVVKWVAGLVEHVASQTDPSTPR